jgi:hypothetical protein
MRKTFPRLISVAFAIILLLNCSVAACRDWAKDPASIEIAYAPTVAVVGDVHGAFPELAASLECLGVAKQAIPDSFRLTWTGGTTLLIFTGDFNDRGVYTREVYDAVMDLETQAVRAGGRVIALLGNHETLLLNGTVEKWANTLKPPKNQHYQNTLDSFTKAGLDFHEAISPAGRYGAWIRRRPLFAVVNGFMFIHGGITKPSQNRASLVADFKKCVDADKWNSGMMSSETGPLWHREWWNDTALVNENFEKLGIQGVVFGHTIGAMGTEGEINVKDDRLIGIDIGMCPVFGKSHGGGLLVTIMPSGKMAFRARFPDRPERILFQLGAPEGARETAAARSAAKAAEGVRPSKARTTGGKSAAAVAR